MALLTTAQAKTHLNITSSTDDTELGTFINVVEDAAEAFFGAAVTTGSTVTESHNGGWEALVLRRTPVVTVSSIAISGVSVSTSSYAVDAGAGVVYSLVGTLGDQPVDTTVVYTAGHSSGVPDDVVQGALELLRHLWQTQRGTVSGRNPFSDDGYPAGTAWSLPRRVVELWEPHRVRAV